MSLQLNGSGAVLGVGAVWGSAYPAFLHFPGGHDNDTGVLLPHHLPEVVDCGLQAALAGDVSLSVLVRA